MTREGEMSGHLTRRRFLERSGALAGGAVIGPGLLAACGGDEAGGGSDVFRVGAVLELSGESATGGQLARRGYDFGIRTINSKGGVRIGDKSYRLEMVVEDCKSQPQGGADGVTRLAEQEKVDALFGAYTSGVQIAMNPICAMPNGSSRSPFRLRVPLFAIRPSPPRTAR